MTNDRTILITGVTGNQGGAVAKTLQGSRLRLRGLTREPGSEQAVALARHGIDVVKGDLDDEATLRRALAGAWGVGGTNSRPDTLASMHCDAVRRCLSEPLANLFETEGASVSAEPI